MLTQSHCPRSQQEYEASVTQVAYSLQRGLNAKANAGQLAANYFATIGHAFPNAMFPFFNSMAASLNNISQVRGVAWLPLVMAPQLVSFEQFANASLGFQWANASLTELNYTSQAAFLAGINITSKNVHGGVFAGSAANHTPVNASAPYYFPLIQEAPLQSNEAVSEFSFGLRWMLHRR